MSADANDELDEVRALDENHPSRHDREIVARSRNGGSPARLGRGFPHRRRPRARPAPASTTCTFLPRVALGVMAVQTPVRDDPMRRLYDALQQAEDALIFEAFAYAATAESGTNGHGPENVVGVGLGERIAGGRPTGQPAVTVYVARKAPRDYVETLIPPDFDGVPTDVVESGEFLAAAERGRERPLSIGLSVGHVDGGTGTLGFFAETEGTRVLVSNNHVIALENNAAPGDLILQPGPSDGGTEADRVAHLHDFVPLDFAGGPNTVDLALAATDEDIDGGSFPGGSLNPDPQDADRNLVVRKRGRTTGVTRGLVTDANATIKLRYLHGTAILREQCLVRGLENMPFSQPGDSGALVIDETARRPVGLVCGGSARYSIMNRIRPVLDHYGLVFLQ
jgi:hypothetical protein